MKKRILSMLLAIFMVVGLLPTAAFAAEDTATAEITGVALIVDGTEYSSGLVTLTAANTVELKAYGTNLQYGTDAQSIHYEPGADISLDSAYDWNVSPDGTYATCPIVIEYFKNITAPYTLRYSNNGIDFYDSNVSVIYESSESAAITGVSITVDGETCSSGNVTIHSNSVVTITVAGSNLQNATNDQMVELKSDDARSLFGATVSDDGTTATLIESGDSFAGNENFEIRYCNDWLTAETWQGTGIYVTYDDSIAEEDKAQITGVTITVDGVPYTEGNVTITPDTQSIIYTLTGTNFANVSDDNIVIHAQGTSGSLNRDGWIIDTEANTATRDFSESISSFDACDSFEVMYSNEGWQNMQGTGIYLTYETGMAEENKARITGVTVTVDGVPYTEGNITITPDTQSIIYTVTGTNFANVSADNTISYAFNVSDTLHSGRWTIDTEANTATRDFSEYISRFEACDNFEVRYSSDGDSTEVYTGIYLTYDDGVEEDTTPAVITGVTVTVDGETYTSGNITITPDTQSIIYTVTGTNFANVSADNIVIFASGSSGALNDGWWEIDAEANTATLDRSEYISQFVSCDNFEVQYSNDDQDTWQGTGIYLTYDDGIDDDIKVPAVLAIGANALEEGYTYTYTAEQDGALYVTVTELYHGTGEVVSPGYLNSWLAVSINGTAITRFDNAVEVSSGDTVTVEMEGLDNDTYFGTVTLSWEAPAAAEITGVTITVDGVIYTEGNVTITPDTQSVIFTLTGTNFAKAGPDNLLVYAYAHRAPLTYASIDTEANTATMDFSNNISAFEGCNQFEVIYTNDDHTTEIGTGIILTYSDGTTVEPDPGCSHSGGEATCTTLAVCEACGESYGELADHTEEILPGKEATCTEPGLTEGECCGVCGEIFTVQEVIDALGHSYENDCDASCNSCGETREVGEHVYISDCDVDCEYCGFIRDDVPHTYSHECDTHCYICGELTRPEAEHMRSGALCKDSECLYGCGLVMSAVADHDYEVYYEQPPTCGNSGAYYYSCIACGAGYEEYPPATGKHLNMSGWENYDDTRHYRYCTDCRNDDTYEYGDHTGGEAGCSAQAVCTECETSYGEKSDVHSNMSGWENYDNTRHYRYCMDCRSEDTYEYGDHTGGEATCIARAVCTECEQDYGEYADVHRNMSGAQCFDETYHRRYCMDCGSADAYEYGEHTGGEATCIARAVCTECETSYGEKSDVHSNMSDWQPLDDAQHFRYCTDCGDQESYEYGPHTGGEATCAAQAVCTECEQSYGQLSNVHGELSGWERYDDTRHYRYCLDCGSEETYEYGTHTGGEATCTSQAACSTCTASYGELSDVHNHMTAWDDYDGTRHYRYCLDCNRDESYEYGDHTGGNATCISYAQCEICEEAYGEFGSHDMSDWLYYSETQHFRHCEVCWSEDSYEYGTHSGKATCVSSAYCETCTNFYGEVGSSHNMSDWEPYSETQHYRYCADCTRQETFEYGDHTGGEATCAVKAVCTECGWSYGQLSDAHNFENGSCTVCGKEGVAQAQITGVSITVDGVIYTEGNVTITPDTQSIVYTVTGTDFAKLSTDNYLVFSEDMASYLNEESWTVDTEANTATRDFSEYIHYFTFCDNMQIQYSNDGQVTMIGTGIYLTYEDGIAEEDKAQITGVSITIDGQTYTEGSFTVTPNSTVVFTVTGTQFATMSADRLFSWNGYHYVNVAEYFTVNAETNTAVWDCTSRIDTFSNCNDQPVRYSNGGDTWITTDIKLTWDNGIPDEEKAQITGVSITVDGVRYTEGDVTIKPDSTIVYTLTGINFANLGSEALAFDGRSGYYIVTMFTVDTETNTAVWDCSDYISNFEVCDGDEVAYWTGETWIFTGIYLTYDDSTASEPTGPVITQQPADSSVKLGERFCVTVEAEGEGLTYRWYFRNKGASRWNVSSVIDSTYDDVMTAVRAGREVYCVITDAFGNSVTTDIATLIGVPEVELQLLTQPNDASAKLGETFCVTVEAQGDGLTYWWFWRKVGEEDWRSSGVRDNTYDDVMTAARHNREVYCVITDAWGNSVTTDIATITGIPTATLAITKQPENQTVPLGDPFCVTVEAVGDGLRYQWYFQNANAEKFSVSGQRDNTYDDVMTSVRHNRSLYCVITDAWGNSVTTDPVVVIMATQKYELQILQQPADASAVMGENFCVTVEAQGDALKYRWYWRNVGAETWNISGQRDNTYDDVMTRARHNREVYCVITDMWGNSVTTDIATITAIPNAVLAIVALPTNASTAMGENFCVTVEAQGDGLRYQWYFRNASSSVWRKSGVTDNTYDDVMTTTRAGREVYCVITDIWGNSVTTETVTLVCTED